MVDKEVPMPLRSEARAIARSVRRHAAAVRAVALALMLLGIGGEPALADPLLEPMRGRNLSPPVAIFGMPAWYSGLDAGQQSRLAVVGNLASHFRFANAGDEALILDGETWRIDFVYERRIGDRWTIAAELPVVRNSGGVLDDFIDAWHSTFQLPDGNRNSRPEDELQLYYDPGSGPTYFRSEDGAGFGDVLLSAATSFGAGDDWQIKFSLKLPTGKTDLLAGSGAADAAVSLLRQTPTRWRSDPAAWFWGAGLMRLGKPERFPGRQQDWVALGMIGASWQPWPTVGLKAQLDLHTAFYHSALDELGTAAVQATAGGWWAIDPRRVLTVAVIEDLIVRAAPDVSLEVGLEWRF
jgi:hypothetical protein